MRKGLGHLIIVGLAMSALSASAQANDDELYTYSITVINRVGETISATCNNSAPRPLANGAAWRFSTEGADGFVIECTGYDHHGEAVAVASETLDHHHLAHTLVLQRGGHH